MAGIGFSINKLVKEKNFSSKPRAFAYAAIVTIGPLLFGELVLVAVYALTNFSKVIVADRNLIVAIITYGLLASLIINGASSLVISRYLSDKLYAKKIGDILTTYWGSQLFLLTVGGLIYGIFIIFSGIGIFYSVLAWLLFCELLLSWNALNFLTILRDYQGLFKSFSLTIVTTCAMGGIFFLIGMAPVAASIGGMIMGYASFFIQTTQLLYRQFSGRIHFKRLFSFLDYFDEFWKLSVIGLSTQLGLLGHVILIWFSPIGQKVKGLFYIAPYYDLTIFLASLSMLATIISFTIFLEVDFFKIYRKYYQSLDKGATLNQIKKIETDMIDCLKNGLRKASWIQTIVTLLSISVGTAILNNLPLGFNSTMGGYFRILCVAYAIYGIANILSLSSMYFGNVEGSFQSGIVFVLITLLMTVAVMFINDLFYGFGFLIGSAVYFILVWWQLEKTTSNVLYQILGKQPIIQQTHQGFFNRLSKTLNKKVRILVRRGS